MTLQACAFLRVSIPLLIFCLGCGNRSGGENGNSVKLEQYFNQGEQLYAANCSNCHQKTGTGLGLVYPPVNHSDFIDSRFEEVICLMRHGRKGELVVNGKMYNQAMPPTTLSDLEIAEIATYVYNSWGRNRGIVEVNTVSAQLQQCDSISSRP